MGQAASAPAAPEPRQVERSAPPAGKENAEGRTLVALKRQRLSIKGDGRATAMRRETSDAAESAPPLGDAANRPPAAPTKSNTATAAQAQLQLELPGVVPSAAACQSPSYQAVQEWLARLPPPAALPGGEERRQSKPSILKPLNMRPDYGAVSMRSGIRELTQNWLDRCHVLAPPGTQVRCVEWSPPATGASKLPAGCFALALVAMQPPSLPEAATAPAEGAQAALAAAAAEADSGSLLLGHLAAFRDPSGRLCYELCNRGTALTLEILTLGASSKRGGGSSAAGAFGDGMKVEVNSLAAAGASVSVATANRLWAFEHKALEDSPAPQLCVTSAAAQRGQPDTVVLVEGAKPEWFRRKDFLALQPPHDASLRMEPQDTHQVSGVEVLTEPQFHGRVFVRGIFFQACANLKGFGLNYLGGHATFPILGIGRDRSHLNLDKLIAALPPLVKHLERDPPAQHRLLSLLYDQLAASDGSNAARYIWWHLGVPHEGKVHGASQGRAFTLDKLVSLFLERHGASALPVAQGAEVKSREFLQCTPVEVSQDLLAVLRGSHTCPTEEALMRRQEARLADPATDYDFSAGGQQATYLDGLRREALAALAPHVTPANLRFKQLAGNRRMVIPFDQRGSTIYAVDVAALDPQAVHQAAAKVGMPKDCPAGGCGCIRLALLNQLVEAVAEQRKLPRLELQSAVMGRVLEATALAGQPPPPPAEAGKAQQPQQQGRQQQEPAFIDLTLSDDGEALQLLPGAAGGPPPGVAADEEGQQMYSRLAARMAAAHLEGTSECHRSGKQTPPQAEPPKCADNLARTSRQLAEGAAFEAGSYLYAPYTRAHPSSKPKFANLPTNRQMLMVRRLHVLLTRLMRDAFGFPPRFYIYWHPHDTALAFNLGGAIWYNAGHWRCAERYRQGTLAWADRYYLLTCHELAHTYVSGHGVDFSNWMAQIAMRFRPAYERLRGAKGPGSLWEAIDAVSL